MLRSRVVAIHSVPRPIIVLTVLVSWAAALVSAFHGWPLWAMVLVSLSPWLPIFGLEALWTYRHYRWLALFYVLALTQTGHFLEHVVQMVQLHVLHLPGHEAHGVFGAFDSEWVHFTWNNTVTLVVFLLVTRFSGNRWLWLTALIAGWHGLEHSYIMWVYLTTGLRGSPGLLGAGGVIGGGLPVPTVDLHFYYNLIETLPLLIAFVYQCRRSYEEADQWVVLAAGARLRRLLEYAA